MCSWGLEPWPCAPLLCPPCVCVRVRGCVCACASVRVGAACSLTPGAGSAADDAEKAGGWEKARPWRQGLGEEGQVWAGQGGAEGQTLARS